MCAEEAVSSPGVSGPGRRGWLKKIPQMAGEAWDPSIYMSTTAALLSLNPQIDPPPFLQERVYGVVCSSRGVTLGRHMAGQMDIAQGNPRNRVPRAG